MFGIQSLQRMIYNDIDYYNHFLLSLSYQLQTTFTTEEPSMYYMRSPQQLLANDVITIFKTLNTNRVARVPPHQPQPGDIFVFDNRRKSGENRNRWKYDGYSWSYRGVRSIQGGSVVKRYYAIRTALRKYNLGFQRVCFNLPGNTDFVVVHYYGDKSLHNPEIPIHVEKAHKALRMTATFPPTILEMYSNVPQLEGQVRWQSWLNLFEEEVGAGRSKLTFTDLIQCDMMELF